MAASFPTSIKSFTSKTDGVDTIAASHVNDLQDEVTAIETALGASMANVAPLTAEINNQSGTTYTIQASDNGKIVVLNNASAITVTVPNSLTAGFNCLLVQKGAGQVTVSAAASGNLRNYNGDNKLAGQYATASLFIESNGGTAPEIYFQGETAS